MCSDEMGSGQIGCVLMGYDALRYSDTYVTYVTLDYQVYNWI